MAKVERRPTSNPESSQCTRQNGAKMVAERTAKFFGNVFIRPLLSYIMFLPLCLNKCYGPRKSYKVKPPKKCIPPHKRPPEERTITMPLADGTGQESLEQMQSRFFKLPAELREMIYEMALGGSNYHLRYVFGRLYRTRFETASSVDQRWLSGDAGIDSHTSMYTPYYVKPPTAERPLALLLTCRKIYSEAIDILYTHNTFALSASDLSYRLSKVTLPHHFKRIVSLQLYYPIEFRFRICFSPAREARRKEIWNTVAGMTDLRVLRVFMFEIYCSCYTQPRRLTVKTRSQILEPLMSLKGLEVFEVSWPWKAFKGEGPLELGDMPVQLIERGPYPGQFIRYFEGKVGDTISILYDEW